MNPDLLVISSFPEKGLIHGKAVVGMASYAKNTLLSIKKYSPETKITVFAEKLIGQDKSYEENNIKVNRVWSRNSFYTFPLLFRKVLTSKNILIEFEVAMFGEFIYLLPFPIFLLLLKVLRKKVFIVSHQVISDIDSLSGHINLNGKTKTSILNLLIHLFYRIILILSTKVIVFDQILKDKLAEFGKKEKIAVIPHGVEAFEQKFASKDAKTKLGFKESDFVLLYFGYLAWYKGTDLLVGYFDNLKNKEGLKLIIAGGPNPNHKNKSFYKKYIEDIEAKCKANGILVTGFVNQEDIPLYFSAGDLVVFPYRTLMSASGPLSIAFSFNKPFIASNSLSGMFETKDLKDTLDFLSLDKNDLSFGNFEEFEERIEKVKSDEDYKNKLQNLSMQLSQKRSWDLIGEKYHHEIFYK